MKPETKRLVDAALEALAAEQRELLAQVEENNRLSRDLLGDLHVNISEITPAYIESIYHLAANEWEVSVPLIRGQSRLDRVVDARHSLWMFFHLTLGLRQLHLAKLLQVERTNISHARTRVAILRDSDPKFRAKFERFTTLASLTKL